MDINRKTAYLALMDIETKGSFSNMTLNSHINRNKPGSPSFVREITYGVLRNRILLDYYIDHFAYLGISKIKRPDLVILRMGIYQLAFMDSVPEYAAVDESVKLAKKYCRGRSAFINGLLRSYVRFSDDVDMPDRIKDETEYLSVRYSYAQWIITLWTEQFGIEKTEKLLESGNLTPVLAVRVNMLKTSKEELAVKLKTEGFEVSEGKLSEKALRVNGSNLLESRLYEDGFLSVQDESSQMAIKWLDPKEGDTVIDVCAAPGGKTLAAAEHMNNKGTVFARDVHEKKLAVIDREAARLGIDIVKTDMHDALEIASDLKDAANKVLVDVPCSGLGVVRRKPEIKYKPCEGIKNSLPAKQLQILENSAEYVRPDGILLYSTCTVNKFENGDVIEKFLKKRKDFEIEKQMQFMPGIDTDGFFICKLKRKM